MRGFPIKRHAKGQAMVEYALIGCLIAIAIGAAIVLTGPAVGNIFSNVITNASGAGTPIYKPFDPATIQAYASSIVTMKPIHYDYETNTPPAPTCQSPKSGWKVTATPPAPPGTWADC
jgi:Flp pilus assembly pilin Flp